MRRLFLLLPLLGVNACESSRQAVESPAFESLIGAERAFAAKSIATDTRTAFLEFFDADGVVFDAGPVNARSVWEQRPAGGPILSWGPEMADVSAAGDMGYTSGPFEVRMAPDSDAVAWGHFVSVWRKNAEGSWKVVADGGVMHSRATLNSDSSVVRVGGGGEVREGWEEVGKEETIATLQRYDSLYSRSVAENGFTEALDYFVDANSRFYRNGHLPFVGRETLSASAAVVEAVWSRAEVAGSIVSESGDLGCTYGILQMPVAAAGAGTQTSASYYRIWKRDASQDWHVVVDVLIPIVSAGS